MKVEWKRRRRRNSWTPTQMPTVNCEWERKWEFRGARSCRWKMQWRAGCFPGEIWLQSRPLVYHCLMIPTGRICKSNLPMKEKNRQRTRLGLEIWKESVYFEKMIRPPLCLVVEEPGDMLSILSRSLLLVRPVAFHQIPRQNWTLPHIRHSSTAYRDQLKWRDSLKKREK